MVRSSEELPILLGQSGPLNEQRWAIQHSLVVGRDGDCDIVVADRQVSRKHARFKAAPEGILLEDLKSKNGTHLNGKRIEEAKLLQDGDTIQIALAQQFVFLSSDATLPLDSDYVEGAPLTQGRLRLDKRSRLVWIGNEEITPPLSVAQFAMLDLLYRREGKVVPRFELVQEIWGEENAYEVSEQALDALVRRLRERLASVDEAHNYIVTVRGHGLRLDNPTE